MDNTRPTPTGSVHATPEAGPLTPPTMRDHFSDPIPGVHPAAAARAGTSATPEAVVTGASANAASKEQAAEHDRTSDEIARDVGERFKPVVEAAEDVATKALDLSAKGLSKLVDMLEERRRQRDPSDPS